jgi:hypothetical protein
MRCPYRRFPPRCRPGQRWPDGEALYTLHTVLTESVGILRAVATGDVVDEAIALPVHKRQAPLNSGVAAGDEAPGELGIVVTGRESQCAGHFLLGFMGIDANCADRGSRAKQCGLGALYNLDAVDIE